MPKHKVLKSVAHNVADSFVSLMNWGGDDYVMGVLLTNAYDTGVCEYFIDFISGAHSDVFLKKQLKHVVEHYSKMFWGNIESQGATKEFVKSARLEVSFNLAKTRPVYGSSKSKESPYSCKVMLIDDKAVDHGVVLTGWW